MNPIYEKLEKCYQCVREKTDFVPEVAIILGSGFGQFADEFEEVRIYFWLYAGCAGGIDERKSTLL